MSYRRTVAVEFNHCDPAGIVFYPRYFEMTNSVTENFFAERVGRSYARMTLQDRNGVPMARLEADFRAPSRLGDRLDFTLTVGRVGRTSVTLAIIAAAGDEIRLSATLTLVWVGADGRPAPWPDDMRTRLLAEQEDDAT